MLIAYCEVILSEMSNTVSQSVSDFSWPISSRLWHQALLDHFQLATNLDKGIHSSVDVFGGVIGRQLHTDTSFTWNMPQAITLLFFMGLVLLWNENVALQASIVK